jgi:glutathione S-transferase
MKLYGSTTSPYVRKARVLVSEKNLPCEFVESNPWPDDSPMIEKNPFSKVPALEIGPGNYLFESVLVVHYLDNVDGRPLTPKDPAGYWQAQWWQALGNGIIDAGIARIMEIRRPEDKQMAGKIAREEKRIQRAIDLGENAMKGGEFLVGRSFSLADLVLGVGLQYTDFRHPHDWRSAHPRLAKWLSGIVRRKSFEETLPPGFAQPA